MFYSGCMRTADLRKLTTVCLLFICIYVYLHVKCNVPFMELQQNVDQDLLQERTKTLWRSDRIYKYINDFYTTKPLKPAKIEDHKPDKINN